MGKSKAKNPGKAGDDRTDLESGVRHLFSGKALQLCPQLLGMQLCRRFADGREVRHPIFEVEAYSGFTDRASHAHRGRTPRNAIMFGSGGFWYVYLCYGVHWMLNLVTGPPDYPEAILIRGAGTVQGPGRLTKLLQIDNHFDGAAVDREGGLWLEPGATEVRRRTILRTPRIGIDSAGSPWREKPWRFVWTDAPGWVPGRLK